MDVRLALTLCWSVPGTPLICIRHASAFSESSHHHLFNSRGLQVGTVHGSEDVSHYNNT